MANLACFQSHIHINIPTTNIPIMNKRGKEKTYALVTCKFLGIGCQEEQIKRQSNRKDKPKEASRVSFIMVAVSIRETFREYIKVKPR